MPLIVIVGPTRLSLLIGRRARKATGGKTRHHQSIYPINVNLNALIYFWRPVSQPSAIKFITILSLIEDSYMGTRSRGQLATGAQSIMTKSLNYTYGPVKSSG